MPFLLVWVHLCSLEAMFQDEMVDVLGPLRRNPGAVPGPLGDESWWRTRWLQECTP